LVKVFSFCDDGSTKITGTTLKWKDGMDVTNGISPEKEGNKRSYQEESFFTWFSETQKDTPDGIHDEVAEIIKEDLWPNPLKYFNSEADEEYEDGEDEDDDGEDEDPGKSTDGVDEDEEDQDDDEDEDC